MSKKGIILAGGAGSRLQPVTFCIPKSLVPLYNKPTIYYSLTTLLKQKCDDILIICRSEFKHLFEMLLGDGRRFNVKISYAIQDEPRGLADAYIVASKFLKGQPSTMILGDNLFIGELPILSELAEQHNKHNCIIQVGVKDASQYGVYDPVGNIFIEKPTVCGYKYAIPGIYYMNSDSSEIASLLHPSKRGELEITDLLTTYLNNNDLHIATENNVVWFDTGTFEDLADASNYIRFLETKFNKRIGDPNYANI